MIKIILLVLASVIGFLLVLAALVLFCKTSVVLAYDDRFSLQLRFLFFRYTVFPQKEKPAKKEKRKKADASAENKKKDSSSKKTSKKKNRNFGASEFMSALYIIATKFLRKIICKKLFLHIRIGGSDAAKIAQDYGTINAFVYTLAGLLHRNNQLREAEIQITPDFTAPESSYRGQAILYTRLIHALRCVFMIIKLL